MGTTLPAASLARVRRDVATLNVRLQRKALVAAIQEAERVLTAKAARLHLALDGGFAPRRAGEMVLEELDGTFDRAIVSARLADLRAAEAYAQALADAAEDGAGDAAES